MSEIGPAVSLTRDASPAWVHGLRLGESRATGSLICSY